jgi:tRNA(adenine34) deaminase
MLLDIFTDEHFMNEALKEARKAFDAEEVPVGCVVVCNNTIIARAYNLTERLRDPTAHAEMQAITAASDFLGGKYLKDCTIYITLEPCLMCAGALNWAQVGKVVYGASDEKKGFSKFHPNPFHPKTKVIAGVFADDSSKLLKEFFKKKR